MALTSAADNVPDQIKDWIDAGVANAGKAAYRGGMEVLASGFGKGLLTAAAITAAVILIGAVVAPGLTFGASYAGISVAQSVEWALPTIGNFLLGSWEGLAVLAAGSTTGSLAAAWGENNRISKEAAECQAVRYTHARESAAAQPALAMEPTPEQCEGHCARLLREQQQQQTQERSV